MIRVANCSADISSEKKPTMPPLVVSCDAVRPRSELIGFGDIEADVGREGGFAHAGSAGDDDKIGSLQTTEFVVEFVETRAEARKTPVALPGFRRHIDGDGERVGKPLETAVVTALFGDRVELAFRLFDMIARRCIDRRIEGAVDDVFADDDQFAPHREIVDGAAVIGGVDDRRRLGGETGEILRDADAAEIVFAQKGLQRDRRREFAGANELRRDIENAAVQFFGEILRLQEIRDAVESVVVDEDRAEQRLFRLDIMRRHPIGGIVALRWWRGQSMNWRP